MHQSVSETHYGPRTGVPEGSPYNVKEHFSLAPVELGSVGNCFYASARCLLTSKLLNNIFIHHSG
jgi:hypothetical protein